MHGRQTKYDVILTLMVLAGSKMAAENGAGAGHNAAQTLAHYKDINREKARQRPIKYRQKEKKEKSTLSRTKEDARKRKQGKNAYNKEEIKTDRAGHNAAQTLAHYKDIKREKARQRLIKYRQKEKKEKSTLSRTKEDARKRKQGQNAYNKEEIKTGRAGHNAAQTLAHYKDIKGEKVRQSTLSQTKEAARKRKQRQIARNKEEIKKLRKLQRNDYMKKYRQLKKNNLTEDSENENYENRMQKRRDMLKLKSSLPATPARRTSLLCAYLNNTKSPTVKKLQRNKVLRSPEEINEYTIMNNVCKDLKGILNQTKYKRSAENLSARKIIFTAISGENNDKSAISKHFDVKRKNIVCGSKRRTLIMKSEKASFRLANKNIRRNNIPDEHKQIAYDYWLKKGNSRPSGNKKDIKRNRLAPKVYVSHMTHILEKTQTEIYMEFKENNPEVKMSQRTFERLKPFYVRAVRESDRNTCMCRYHVEFKSVFNACMLERKNLLERTDDQEIKNRFAVYKSINDLVAQTLCPKSDGSSHYSPECLRRECEKCGVSKFKIMPEEMSDTRTVKWEKFEYVDIVVKNTLKRKKLQLVKKQTPIRELFQYITELLANFPIHQFRANWQNGEMKTLLHNLPANDVAVVHDFSENYRIAAKDELQTSYFQRTEVTVHVSILHRHALAHVDGTSSTEDNPQLVTEQFFVISNDDKHDNNFVYEVQRIIKDYLDTINYTVDTMHEFTDGCQAQYKSRHCLGDVSYACEDLQYKRVIRNFFESSHAKGPQDAAGGYLKRQIDLAILRGKATINSAHDAFLYADKHLRDTQATSSASRRIFRFLDFSDIKRNRRFFKPVLRNREIHQVISVSSGELLVRDVSCYSCDSCFEGRYENCVEKNMTNERHVKMKQSYNKHAEEEIEEQGNDVSACIREGSLVVLYTDDEAYPYYLLRASSDPRILEHQSADDWSNIYL